MEKKDMTGLKTTVALMLLLLFFFVQGAIVVITKIKGVQSAIVRGTGIWSLVVITLAYFRYMLHQRRWEGKDTLVE